MRKNKSYMVLVKAQRLADAEVTTDKLDRFIEK